MFFPFLSLFLGIAFLVYGGRNVVTYSVDLAIKLKVSELFIGIVVIGLGTSLPELFFTSYVSLEGFYDLAVGGIIGSNIANTLLVFCLMLIFINDNYKYENINQWDIYWMIFSTIFLSLFIFNGKIDDVWPIFFIILLVLFYIHSFRGSRVISTQQTSDFSYIRISGGLVFGFLLLYLGTYSFIYGTKAIGHIFAIPDGILGLSIAAIGTSAPELLVTIISIRKGSENLAIGNIIGSNITNIFGVLGLSSLLVRLVNDDSIVISEIFTKIHLMVLIISSIIVLFIVRVKPVGVLRKSFGYLGLISYALYISYILI